MNLFDLGGQFLRVGRAITPPESVINPALAPLPIAIPINQPKLDAVATAAKLLETEPLASATSPTGKLIYIFL